MKAAQQEPEKYTDTYVRVAGYSAKFIDLARYSQDTIIARTEHDLASQM
ncbi:MAG: glycine radical domain-containing protein [Deltaproteobacteria bacterium]